MVGLLQVPLTTESFPGLLLRPLSYIGQHSYPIYVFHIMILLKLLQYNVLHGRFGITIYFVTTVVVGILFSRLIEFPVLHLRDRLFPPEVVPRIPIGAPQSDLSVRPGEGPTSHSTDALAI
jgi:peptidoglycan/LPS O-acetylase OafA/YrhL